MTANSVRSELAAAFRAVGDPRRLPEDMRPDVAWAATDDLLETALGTDDRAKAIRGRPGVGNATGSGLFEEAAR